MAAPPLTSGRRTAQALAPLATIFAVTGLSTSFVGPYLAFFLTDEIHAGPLRTTFFLIVAPVSGVTVSWWVGRISDRRPIRRRLLVLASLAGVAAAGLTAVVRDYWLLLALTVTLTALAGSLFPQTFAYAREFLHRTDPDRTALRISMLRTVFSAAWVAGPPVAALLLSARGFTATYAFAALMYAVAALVAIFAMREVPAAEPSAGRPEGHTAPAGRRIYVIIAGFTAVQVTLTLGVQALPLYVSADLGGSVRSAGLILGLCAALEIPLMLAFGMMTTRIPARRLILTGVLAAIAYQAVATAATEVWMLAAAQVLNAVCIAAVSGLGISYVQDLLPGEPGRASTLIANTFPAGAILSAPAFGLAQHFGFRLAFGLNVALCALGLLLLVIGGRVRRTASPA